MTKLKQCQPSRWLCWHWYQSCQELHGHTFCTNIFAKIKKFVKPFIWGPGWVFKPNKKLSKIMWHCPFKRFNLGPMWRYKIAKFYLIVSVNLWEAFKVFQKCHGSQRLCVNMFFANIFKKTKKFPTQKFCDTVPLIS